VRLKELVGRRPIAIGAPDLAAAADDNLALHAGWVQEHVEGMRVVADRDLVLVDSGLSCDTFNLICRARLEQPSAPDRVREAIATFRDAGRPFSWWLGPGDQPHDLGEMLLDAGLEQAETELAMAADLASLRIADLSPGGLRIERVRTPAQLRDFAKLIGTDGPSTDPLVRRFYEMAAGILLASDAPLRFYVGYLDDVPVATGELTVGGGVVGLYSISTLASYRRRGIGTAMTLRPLLDARAEGYRTGILQAAPAGVGVYSRVGFRSFGQITEYKPPRGLGPIGPVPLDDPGEV
jgi:ribosomal protein S18 acetylase RimI-like enzyme